MKKSFQQIVPALVMFCVLLFSQSAGAWLETGHRTIAMIAWEDLTPKTKSAVMQLLQQHPRYEKDLLSYSPTDATPMELDRHAFTGAAVWPDMVRSQSHPMHAQYNHPGWHFIDIAFVEPGQTAPPERADAPAGPHNAVEALTKCAADLKDANVTPADKAIALCWVEHLVGDIHQPMHAVTLVSPEYPKGDQGGNAELVLREPPYPDSRANLHFIWDALPGNFRSEQFSQYEATGLRSDRHFCRDVFNGALAITDFAAWAQESHDLAVTDAYLNGQLKSVPVHNRSEPRGSIPGLPPGYLEHAEQVALRQMALAGYRLADQLNRIFDPR